MEDNKEAIQSLKILQTYLEDIKVTGESNRFNIQFKSFFDELGVFFSDLDSLKKRLGTAVQQNNFEEFSNVKQDALKLKQKLENSQIMVIYSKYRVHSLLDLRVNGFVEDNKTSTSQILNSKEWNNKRNSDGLINQKDEPNGSSKDDYIKLMENYAHKYVEIESKVLHLNNENSTIVAELQKWEQTNKDLQSKINSFEEEKKEREEKYINLESKVENLNNMHAEDEKKIEKLEEGIAISYPYLLK